MGKEGQCIVYTGQDEENEPCLSIRTFDIPTLGRSKELKIDQGNLIWPIQAPIPL